MNDVNQSGKGLKAYLAVMLTIAVILLGAILGILVYAGVKVSNESKTVSSKVDNFNTQVKSINTNLENINNELKQARVP